MLGVILYNFCIENLVELTMGSIVCHLVSAHLYCIINAHWDICIVITSSFVFVLQICGSPNEIPVHI